MEVHRANSDQYCGAKLVYYNTSIMDCNNIVDVEVCYEWRITASSPSNCNVSASRDDSTWAAVDSTCYTSYSFNCVNVTSALAWTCDDFFGASATGAYLRQNARSNQASKRCRIDVLYYTVTYS